MTQRQCQNNWIETYIQFTQFQEAPLNFHIWTALSLIAAVTGRNVYMDRAYFKTYPNLYVALVGPSGEVSKTTASDIGVGLLNSTNVRAALPDFELIQGKASSWYLYHWFGQRSASGKDSACYIYSDEMKAFMGELNKNDLITLLTQLYTPKDYFDHHLKNGGKLTLKNTCVNLLVCSTPEWLTTGTNINDIHGGFTGRFVYIYEETTDRDSPFPEDFVTPEILKLKDALINDLILIAAKSGQFHLTDDAKAEYSVWYHDRKKEWTDERLKGYYSRKRDLVFKLAMLISLAHDDSLVITPRELRGAWQLLRGIEDSMVGAFRGVVEDPSLRYQGDVLNDITKAGSSGIARSDILRKYSSRFDHTVLDRIIDHLMQQQLVDHAPGKRGGARYKLKI